MLHHTVAHRTAVHGANHAHHLAHEVFVPPGTSHPRVDHGTTSFTLEIVDHVGKHVEFGFDPNHFFLAQDMEEFQKRRPTGESLGRKSEQQLQGNLPA